MPHNHPNILLIQADQLKPQVLSSYGGSAVTPYLDQLADQGVVFENAYCNFPLCAPSRFSMLSGMLPSRIGAFDNGAEYLAQIPTVAHYLRLAGYRTCLSGKQHFVGPDMLHGFHERLVPELYPTDFSWTPSWDEVRMNSNNNSSGVTRAGICARSVQMDHDEAVLYRAKAKLHDYARIKGQPFFLVASFTHPHEPYFALQKYWDRYRHDDIPMPITGLQPENKREVHTQRMLHHHSLIDGDINNAHIRIARHGYLSNVSYFDDMVGDLMATLEHAGLLDNTMIMVTSDHGDMLGEHGLWFKKHFFDHCSRVPLIVHAPRHFSSGRSLNNVSLVDLLPTLCEFADFNVAERAPQPLDGASLLPQCEHPDARDERPVFSEITSEGVPAPMLMVRDSQFKLIKGGQAPAVLYDLEKDPQEQNNVAEQASLLDVRERLENLALNCWDYDSLEEDIRLSQRRRRLVQAAHEVGDPPVWDSQPEDPTLPWIHRGPEEYNDWAWLGITKQ